MQKITESDSRYRHLEQMDTRSLLTSINQEDKTVPLAIEKVIPAIEILTETIVAKLKNDGRLFYIGAGTSGRLGVLDASECPPTYGVSDQLVIGIIAGGEYALRNSIEDAEDSTTQGWKDLRAYQINEKDIVIGIAASGTTPYVVHALVNCQQHKITTASICCNPGSLLSQHADYPIEVIVGPEFVTGSTRMKAGTAQKLILNMISTSVMIRLGRVLDNKMVDMQLSNEKLIDRGVEMLANNLSISHAEASDLLDKTGSVRQAIAHYNRTN